MMTRIVGRDDTRLKINNLSANAKYVYNNTDPGYTILEHLSCDDEGKDIYYYDILEHHTIQRAGLTAHGVNEYFEDILADGTWSTTWYAVMRDREDDDWSTGSFDLEEAKEMARDLRTDYPDAYIAVINDVTKVCIDEIHDID